MHLFKVLTKSQCIFFYLIIHLSISGQNLRTPPNEDIKQELTKFKNAWHKEVATDSYYSIQNIITLLNLDYPGFEKIKKAVEEGKWEVAKKELLAYFKNTKVYTKKTSSPLSDIEAEAAENALNHIYRGNKDAHPPIYRGAGIDWVGAAYHNGKHIQDQEWYFIFQRLLWWEALAKSYDVTGNEKYFNEWQYELVDYARKNLPFSKQSPHFVSRGMETYYRCQRHSFVLPYFIQSENFDSKTLLYFLGSFHQQAEHIRTVYSKQGNHLLGELSNVFMNAINFPEFKKSKEWLDETLERIPERLHMDIYPDGMNRELIFSYHKMYMNLYGSAYVLFKENGYGHFLSPDYYELLIKMANIYAHQSFPDNTICMFGDAWKHRNVSAIVKEDIGRFGSDLYYFDFMTSRGKIGTPPAQRNVAYPLSGFYFMRSQWTPNAVFMAIKNTQGGQWHSQIDNGTFELYAYGRNFMNDSGSYIYNSDDKEEQKLRKWFQSTIAHQTLTLDNQNINLDPKHILWDNSNNLTTLIFENNSYSNLTHRRTVLFIDNKYFLIYDQAIGNAEGEVSTHFQFVPCDFKLNSVNHTAETQFKNGANLLVKSFPVNQQLNTQEEKGYISYKILRKENRPAWSYMTKKTAEDPSVSFLTALIPYRENKKPSELHAEVKHNGDLIEFMLKTDEKNYMIKINLKENQTDLLIANENTNN